MDKELSDVIQFHSKFGLMTNDKPGHLTHRKVKERLEFIFEEFSELVAGCGFLMVAGDEPIGSFGLKVEFHDVDEQDLEEQADALVDLVYVIKGTAAMMGLPWDQLWDDVQRANMTKERGIGKRGHLVDCIKPEGWVGPKTGEILRANGYNKDEDNLTFNHRDDEVHQGVINDTTK